MTEHDQREETSPKKDCPVAELGDLYICIELSPWPGSKTGESNRLLQRGGIQPDGTVLCENCKKPIAIEINDGRISIELHRCWTGDDDD